MWERSAWIWGRQWCDCKILTWGSIWRPVRKTERRGNGWNSDEMIRTYCCVEKRRSWFSSRETSPGWGDWAENGRPLVEEKLCNLQWWIWCRQDACWAAAGTLTSATQLWLRWQRMDDRVCFYPSHKHAQITDSILKALKRSSLYIWLIWVQLVVWTIKASESAVQHLLHFFQNMKTCKKLWWSFELK